MSSITWLHLSDWHQVDEQNSKGFDRNIIKQALINDIKNRKTIDENLQKIDFVIFSGDLTYSGQPAEFKLAYRDFLEPVLEAANLNSKHLYIVPGNHDLDHQAFKYLPAKLAEALIKAEHEETEYFIKECANDRKYREYLLKPFENYENFLKNILNCEISAYADITTHELFDKKVVFLGYNSALMCGRTNKGNEINDEGIIFIGEHQVDENINKIPEETDIVISVMHHPFSWLHKTDKRQVESLIKSKSHFILHGHQLYEPNMIPIPDFNHKHIIIPAGACYKRENYSSYNYVHFDLSNQSGKIFFRQWSNDANLPKWRRYFDIDENSPDGIIEFELALESINRIPDSLPSNGSRTDSQKIKIKGKTAFVHSQKNDFNYLYKIADFLRDKKIINVILPPSEEAAQEASSEEITNDFEECMSTSNIAILIYKDSSNVWIRKQIMACIRHSKTEKKIDFDAIFIITSNNKPKLNIEHEMIIYCCEDDLEKKLINFYTGK